MRSLLPALIGALALAPSCSVRSVDLGADVPAVDAAPPTVDAREEPITDAGPSTLEARLRALCKAPSGPADRYASARALTERLVGQWYLCDDPALSPLGDPPAVSVGADGQWWALRFDAAREALVRSTDADEQGTFEYAEAAIGPDAGYAGPRLVARDDPTSRNGLFVTLRRGVSTDIVMVVEFETAPRRMLLRSAGPSKNSAFYVAVP